MNINKNKQVLIVAPGLRVGGVEKSLLGLLNSLDPAKCDITLFLYRHDGELMSLLPASVKLLPEIQKYADVDNRIAEVLLRNPTIAIARLAAKWITALRNFLGVRGELLPRSVRYSVPFLPFIPGEYDTAISFLGPHDPLIKRVKAKKRIGWIHTDHTQEAFDKKFEIETWRNLNQIIAVSDGVAATFISIYPKLSAKISVIENVFSPDLVRSEAKKFLVSEEVSRKHRGLVLCTVARLSSAKGIDLGIESARILKEQNLDFVWFVVGAGPDEAMLRRLVKKYGLEEEFILLGQKLNPYPYMQACDIYVQPSRYEGKAVAVREAQALGKLVIITNYPTALSQVRDGIDGVIAGNTPDEISRAITKLSKDGNLKNRIQEELADLSSSNRDEVEKFYEIIR